MSRITPECLASGKSLLDAYEAVPDGETDDEAFERWHDWMHDECAYLLDAHLGATAIIAALTARAEAAEREREEAEVEQAKEERQFRSL